MIMIFLYIIFICIYLVCPFWVKPILLLINTIIPDPIPFVDEVIMWGGLLSKLATLGRISEFVSENKKMSIVIGFGIIIVLISILSNF